MMVSFQNRVKLAQRVFNKTAFLYIYIKITNSERKKKKKMKARTTKVIKETNFHLHN